MKNTNKKHQNILKPGNKLSLNSHKDSVIGTSQSEQRLSTGHHLPVLLLEVLTYLNPQKGESYLDLTAGYGGHAAKILERTLQPRKAVLVDRDQSAIDYLTQQYDGEQVEIIHNDYASAAEQLLSEGKQFDIILADLGVSSPHLDSASRGFSVRLDGPLDMRMDQSQELTASDIVNTYSEVELANLIRRFGEEPRANRIARLIGAHRPITTTNQLAQIVTKAWPGYSKHHPATRTFQALRIAVNDELSILKRALPLWIKLLAPSGRLVIISFHSLEDRLVKQALSDEAGERYDASLRLLTKSPVTANDTELVSNPRARSAKLRAAAKINKEGE
ncbi:MAG TPA: 16S rRNA (cytosine(1402)-N(4))-methyltransferase RsmH [Candidatus Saccharimonadales bacterium]|nr:16S rRNA (cytosine(1402)-N(4))-methyltransferase RsmH [Candidatus Saccharimonadales bacterium]